MPIEHFGSFMKTIPAPLGTVTIFPIEGDPVQGFLCEPAGLSGARDVTALGDWRQFITEQQTAAPDPVN